MGNCEALIYFIIKEHNHCCDVDDCPICELILQCENQIKHIGMTLIVLPLLFCGIISVTSIIKFKLKFVYIYSLVKVRVRLNN